jgi:zinc transport system substrate-binding protein
MNPHLWLNPLLAKQVVTQTAAALSEIDPAHQQQYQQNAEQLQARLDALHLRLEAKLAPVKTIPYVVFHDAYQYFENAYGLNAVGSITVDPERQPGAKRILEMREKIQSLNARCVFSEPQFEPRLLATLIEGTGARTGTLDPLGSELPAGPESYFLLLNNLADDLLRGLQ